MRLNYPVYLYNLNIFKLLVNQKPCLHNSLRHKVSPLPCGSLPREGFDYHQSRRLILFQKMDESYYEEHNLCWANVLPRKQGLYQPELEKDACGVGFICHIKGDQRHDIVRDARHVLCNMTHRGATGADKRDGDGAGVMTGIPHELFEYETNSKFKLNLPPRGEYAVGNIFFHPQEEIRDESVSTFEQIARDLGLMVLCWRRVPVQSEILGPVARGKEPVILQPFIALANIVLKADYSSSTTKINNKKNIAGHDDIRFERQLYLLRKNSTREIGIDNWFYICSLSSKNIVYKGQLAPVQVYDYFDDLRLPMYKSHFALVHSRFSTNTFPSWDRAQPMRWCAHNGI